MKIVIFLMTFLMTFSLYGYVGKIVGESIEEYVSACGYFDPPWVGCSYLF